MCSCLDSRLILALEIDPASGRPSFNKEYREETVITNGFSRAVGEGNFVEADEGYSEI